MGFIYKVTNTVNGKMYIGQTKRTIEQRWKQHVYSSFKDSPYDKGHFHLAIKKYGAEAFVVEQVEKCKNADLNKREAYWIKYFDTFHNGYNNTTGGEHPLKWDGDEILGLWAESLCVKDIAKRLGISHRMVADRLRGYGISVSETTARGMKQSGITSRKPVYMYDRDGNYIRAFVSRHEAAKAVGYRGTVNSGSFFLSTVCGYQFRRYKVDKLDVAIVQHEREVHQYTMDGEYVATFSSLREASRAIKGDELGGASIGAVCRERQRRQAYGYRWSFNKVERLSPLRPTKKCRPVVRITMDGKERTEYPSAAQAGRENGVSDRAIIDACMGKQRQSAGYRWEYVESAK